MFSKNKKIIAVHLLNDFSGSPFVLRQSLEVLVKEGYHVQLFTNTTEGFLTDIDGIESKTLFYKWSKNRYLTLFFYLFSQLALFSRLLCYAKKNDVIYINSILPFGAALAGWVKRVTVLYHIHEVSIKPQFLKRWLIFIANLTATKGLFVSKDLRERTHFKKESSIIYNSLPAEFITQTFSLVEKKAKPFTITMICSLKLYKGLAQFIECATRLSKYHFVLVVNASEIAIRQFCKEKYIPANLAIFPSQKNVHPFYNQTDIVVNFSLPDQWIETFGMTILEAMYYKKPVIIPNIGGITELINHEKEGFIVDPRDVKQVCNIIQLIANSTDVYHRLSMNAYERAKHFTPAIFSEKIKKEMNVLTKNGETTLHASLQLSMF